MLSKVKSICQCIFSRSTAYLSSYTGVCPSKTGEKGIYFTVLNATVFLACGKGSLCHVSSIFIPVLHIE